ncbi:MAG: hypothetical protein SGPRY_007479, partial [Prymnesium sp.]
MPCLSRCVQEAEKARESIMEAQKALRAANDRMSKHEETILSVLKALSTRTVTIESLHRTQVGATVNKLRKLEVSKISELSQRIVLAWKSLVERGDRTGAKIGEISSTPPSRAISASSSQHSRSPVGAGGAARHAGVLDIVRDEHGRVERRIADPDSHEDQLALQEAAEAERIWQEKFGPDREARTSGHTRLEKVASHLKARYQEKEDERKKKVIQQIEPRAMSNGKKRQPTALPVSRGKDPRR